MNFKHYILINIIILLAFLVATPVFAQTITRINGKVIDAKTKEPLPFVSIVFKGKNIGTITDYNGNYSIETQWASNKLEASYLGYKFQAKDVLLGKKQTIDFEIEPNTISLDEVVIVSKRLRYRNKNNPAVDLIKKVIKNKKLNRKEHLDFYEYVKYEKMEFDINNITEKFKNKKVFKKFQFVFNYVDTADLNGKPYLPVYIQEKSSKIYYRKTPKDQKEFILGTKMIGFHDYIDNEGVNYMIDNMYQEIDLYNDDITLLTNQFISPLSSMSPNIYKFHIIDTIDVNGYDCINLAFQPRNKQDFAFKGNLYIRKPLFMIIISLIKPHPTPYFQELKKQYVCKIIRQETMSFGKIIE